MRLYSDSSRPGSYVRDGEYDLAWMVDPRAPAWCGYERPESRKARLGMLDDPKRLAHCQSVFEKWVETGVEPSREIWWLLPDELAQYEAREAACEAERQLALAASVFPTNALTHG